MKRYDTLFAAGCSFTWHRPLKLEETWPYHLQQRLRIRNLFNWGKGGGSNYTVWRMAEKFCRTEDTTNTLAVIQLTNPLRFESYEQNPNLDDTEKNYSDKNWVNHIASQIKHLENGKREHQLGVEDRLRGVTLGTEHLNTRVALWNKSFEFYSYLQQIYAIDGVLRKAGIDTYYMNYNCSHFFDPKRTQNLSSSFTWINGNFDEGDIVNVGQLRNKQGLGLKPGMFVHEGDHHPNSAGNAEIAKGVALWIKENPLP